jgi:glyoxylase-like metal-dependent hydrolase (beta-lactamase superfamily II)
MEVKIYPIHCGFTTVYALKGDGVILIDGGDPNKLDNIRKGIAKALIQPEEIKLIILTHGHWDHVGSTRDIKQLTGAKILLHRGDMHFIAEQKTTQPPGLNSWGRTLHALLTSISPMIHVPKFEVDIIAEDKELSLAEYGIPGRIIPTPGHSWGSVSVLLDSGDVFVGDLAMNLFPLRLNPGLPIFGDDMTIVKNSWKKLLDRDVKTIYPAHGNSFPSQIMRKLIQCTTHSVIVARVAGGR